MIFKKCVLVVLALSTFLVFGCGSKGDVSGKVTYSGKPLVFGTVTFIGSNGIPVTAAIGKDGSYQVNGVTTGTAKIIIESVLPPEQPGNAPGGRGRGTPADLPKDAPKVDRSEGTQANIDPEIRKNWFAIPTGYGDVTSPKLTFDVKGGKNTHNIDLK